MKSLVTYPRKDFGHTELEVNEFYDRVKSLSHKCVDSDTHWEDGYIITEYKMPDGSKAEYVQNMDLGIPSYIKYW